MIKSMTAYASAEASAAHLNVTVEMRAYNSRFLDIVLRLPKRYSLFEERLKKQISSQISRGRIEVSAKIEEPLDETYAFEINQPKAQAYFNAVVNLKELLNLSGNVTLDMLLETEGLIKPTENKKNLEEDWPAISQCVEEAISALVTMRAIEGQNMAADLTNRLNFLQTCVSEIEERSSNLLDHYQQRLKDRISKLTQATIELDPVRIAQEAAFLADRSDISEEIVRSRSHIQQFRSIMASDEPAGRKLNFLLQEFNRELNTMGSKSESPKVSHLIVEAKSELEKLREQVQNIE
jgi:uncharacterized protein (TIGR00255 family)